MRNSRKYVNPSINGSRNIFTSLDLTPNALNATPSTITGVASGSSSITISGINAPISLAFVTSNGTYAANHTLQFFKNGILIDNIPVTSRISSNRILSQQFYNNDILTITAAEPSNSISYTLTIKSLILGINNSFADNVTNTIIVSLN